MPVTTYVELDLDRDAVFEVDVSQYLIEANGYQGRKKSLDPVQPATVTVKLNNADGRFSPDNGAGAYAPDFDDNCRGIRITVDSNVLFTGYIVGIEQDPFIETQEVMLTCVDRLGLLADQTISCGLIRQQPLSLVLNRLIDLLEKGEEITNPGGEDRDGDGLGDSTHWSTFGSGGVTLTIPQAISFEGDYCVKATCDGSSSGQGVAYALPAAVETPKAIALFARCTPGDGAVTLTLKGLDAGLEEVWAKDVPVVDDAWTYCEDTDLVDHKYIVLCTQSAVALTILVDCLHQVPITNRIASGIPDDLDALVEILALYNAPGLEALGGLVATEGAGFLYMGDYDKEYGVIYASAQVVRDAKTTPSATFGDNGTNVKFVGLKYGLDAKERVSEVQVKSQGSYQDGNEEAILWQLQPTGAVIPASGSLALHAHYSQPARKCSLAINSNGTPTVYAIAATGNDGRIHKSGTTYPPTTTTVVQTTAPLTVGQYKITTEYHKHRSYVRADTSGIGGGATILAAKLRLKLKWNHSDIPFTLQVRTKAWGATLEAGDWDGTGTVRGTYSSADLPPVGQWIEIDIAVAGIQKTAWTEFELTSDREVANTQPTGYEHIDFESFDHDFPPELLVTIEGVQPDSVVFENYGAGADIELTAGANPLTLDYMAVTGVPLQAPSEESLVIAEAGTPPELPRTLPVEMPHQGSRTADMVAEAERLAARYSGKVRRLPLSLQEEDAASLTQMKSRQLDDLVGLINTAFAFSTKINDLFFIEGKAWEIGEQGKVLRVVLDLEEK